MAGPQTRRLAVFAVAALAAHLLSGCAGETAQAPAPQVQIVPKATQIENGRKLAATECASCHAVGTKGLSPVARAPLFRTVLGRYNADMLATELIVGVRVAHKPMPQFQFDPAAADALVAYLRTVQTARPGRRIAQQRCARCHAVGVEGTSPYPGALALRALGQRWRRDHLRDALKTGIIVEHDKAEARIPVMKLNDTQIDALLAYLDSIATAENPAPAWR